MASKRMAESGGFLKFKVSDAVQEGSRQAQTTVKSDNKDTKVVNISVKKKVKCIATYTPRGDDDGTVVKLVKTTELDKHIRNIKQILKNSNATPIKRYAAIGYMCCYCRDEYQNPADLKKHTLITHDDISEACFLKELRMFDFCVKLDITALSCKLCGNSIDTIEKLIEHLQAAHEIKMFTDIKNQILPFKFESDTLQCFICSNAFHKFRTLLQHMATHYKNYICDICGAGFVNQRRRDTHKLNHNTGTYPCAFCAKVYTSKHSKIMHEKVHHSGNNKCFKCGYCTETFKWFHAKEKHLSEVHNVRGCVVKCQACDKTFATRAKYTVHMKRDHLMHRPHECSQCDMKFAEAPQLRNHMVSHGGAKIFKCEVCLKAYQRKKTLTEHMKIHNNDRRFKCEHCGQAFVQKCSWRGHMRSKHGELV